MVRYVTKSYGTVGNRKVWIGPIRNGMVRYANDIVRIEPVQNGMVCYGTQWYSTVRTGVERNGMAWYGTK
jgi:hypothetical protein